VIILKGYVFVSNSSKPTTEKYESREKVICGNVSKPCIQAALNLGYEVFHGVNRARPEELECNMPVNLFEAHTYRSLTNFKDNRIAYKNFMKVLNDNNIEAIHCNTPIGGTIGRLCGKIKKVKKVIYTAHGFHCYKGAPLFNRTILKWAEQIMAHWTDAIITMNQEDYEFAKSLKLRKGGKAYLVHGVGINTEDFFNVEVDTSVKRDELGLKVDDIILISMGDLIPRKNYSVAIKAIAEVNNDKLHYLICGRGPELESLKALANELGVENQIHFLGFRTDIKELAKTADIFLFTTKQEGMPRSMMEAMACGLPCIASKIRGNVDIIEDGINGYLCNTMDYKAFSDKITKVSLDNELRKKMSAANLEKIKEYDISVVEKEMQEIYNEILK
jgi:glycosyltransferase involved in cell wall biosynthesis